MKIGDMVRSERNNFYLGRGEVGVIIDNSIDGMVGVKWQKFRLCRHSCNGHCTNHFGSYVYPDDVRVIK
jgi:hypothetical protein